MGLKGITMNTAAEAEPHIYAEDDAAIYESIVGADGVFSIGQKCKATVLSNNQVRVADGVLCIGGHLARIPYGDYVDVSIANGQSGYKRNDIIIGKIVSTGSGGIDTMTCEVKQGAAAATASDPALTQDNLYEGGKIREISLYRVRIEGLSIVAVEQLFTVIPTIPQVQEQLAQLNRKTEWIRIYNGTGLLLTKDTVIPLNSNLEQYTEIRFLYRYGASGYCYESTYKLGTPTNNFTLFDVITSVGKIYSVIGGKTSGTELSVVASGETNGVYLMQVLAKKGDFV